MSRRSLTTAVGRSGPGAGAGAELGVSSPRVEPHTADRRGVERAAGESTSRSVAATLSPVVYLAAVVGLSIVVRLAVGLATPSPWILPDELLYTELARAIADGGLPAVRGDATLGWGVVYPLLIAPAWAVFDDPVDAYRAALAINAVLMSLAAVPAYLLARLFVGRTASLLVAAGSVLTPMLALTSVVMTENAAYPAFLLALWLVARAVRTPTVLGQLAMLGALGLLTLTRVQGAVLLPVFFVAAGLYALGLQPGTRVSYVRRLAPTAVVTALALVLPPVLSALGWAGGGWFGQRSGTLQYVRFGEVPRLLQFQTADLLLFVAVVPVLATATMVGMGLMRRAAWPHRLFASVALPTVGAVLGSAISVSSTYVIDGSQEINERYVMYLAPILLVGLAVWIDAGLPRPRWTLGVVLACVLLAALLPSDRLEVDARYYAPALAPWVALSAPGPLPGILAGLFALAVALLWLRCSRARSRVLWATTLGTMGVLGLVTMMAYAGRAASANDVAGVTRPTWVDDAVPDGQRVTLVWDHGGDPPETERVGWISRADYQLMLTEFFNPSIGSVYRLDPPTITENQLPTRGARVDDSGTLMADTGSPVSAGVVLTPCNLRVGGRRLAESADGGLVLTEVNGVVRARAARCVRAGS